MPHLKLTQSLFDWRMYLLQQKIHEWDVVGVSNVRSYICDKINDSPFFSDGFLKPWNFCVLGSFMQMPCTCHLSAFVAAVIKATGVPFSLGHSARGHFFVSFWLGVQF